MTLRCLLLSLLLVCGVLGFDIEIDTLTDANFEHDTQATTGSTTGRWLVLFHDSNDRHLNAHLNFQLPRGTDDEHPSEMAHVSMIEELQEAGVVVGFMDYNTNPETVQRLKVPGPNHAIVLFKGKMYRTSDMDEIRDFALSEYELVTAEEIPPVPSPLEAILAHPNAKMGLAGVVGSVVLLALALVVRSMTGGNPAGTKKKN